MNFLVFLVELLAILSVNCHPKIVDPDLSREVDSKPANSNRVGLTRVTGDGPKAEIVADPAVDMGITPPLTTEEVLAHPNFRHLPQLTDCGYAGVEEEYGFGSVSRNRTSISPFMEESVVEEEEESRPKRIVGGKPVVGDKHPWMVQIYVLNISSNAHLFHCAGTLISSKSVLTAGHCLTRVTPGTSLDVIVFGHLDRRKVKFCKTNKTTENCSRDYIRDIEDHEVHIGYSEGNLNHDIGIIYLKTPINFTNQVRPICLPYSSQLLESWDSLKLTAAGWGAMDKYLEGSPRSSDVLKEVVLDLQSRKLCDKFHTRIYGRTLANRICVGGNTGRATCNGDSGGGLTKSLHTSLLKGKERVFQLGIVSAGGHITNTCGFQGRPILAINVIYYLDWILNHISPGVTAYTREVNGSWTESSDDNITWSWRKTHSFPYINEFSTGINVDITQHPKRSLLGPWSVCGIMNEASRSDEDVNEKPVVTIEEKEEDHSESQTKSKSSKNVNVLRRAKRMVGGVPTTAQKYLPWMVQIYVRNVETNEVSLRCSGSLISPRHILTAAHCITDLTVPFVFDSVMVGQYNRVATKECISGLCYRPVKVIPEDVIVHAEYERYTHKNNIAMIRLGKDLQINRMVRPICLPQREKLTDGIHVHRYFVAGWGRTVRDTSGVSGNLTVSNILLQLPIDLLPRRECDSVYSRSVDLLDRSRICGGGKAGRGECTGDGGSPLMKTIVTDPENALNAKAFQFGIVSFTDCGMEGMPTIYLNIIYYMPWILDNL